MDDVLYIARVLDQIYVKIQLLFIILRSWESCYLILNKSDIRLHHLNCFDSNIHILTSRKPVRCTGKLLKIKSKLILISFTFFVEFFFFVVQNVVGKIDKETLRIKFRIDPTFGLKK